MTRPSEDFQYEDFRTIAKLAAGQFEQAISQLRKVELVPMRPETLFSVVEAALKSDSSDAEALSRQALIVHNWSRQGGLDVEGTKSAIRDALEADPSWTARDSASWHLVEELFSEFVSLPIVRLAGSAVDLSYEYANIWRGARILTDIRPLFSDDATRVEGAVVSHTFRVRFDSIDGRRELIIAMDESDIHELSEQCERAIMKARTACDLMKSKAEVPTMIAGDIDNA